jgi:hypothetical protein
MPVIRTSNPSEPSATQPALQAAAFVVLVACAPTQAYEVKDDGRRRPDGVAVDPLSAPPAARDVAPASGGVVALKAPLGTDDARSTVKAFFEAVAREDGEAMQKLLGFDALWIHPSTKARDPAYAVFARRFGKLDYTALAGLTFWQESQIIRGNEAPSMWADLVGAGQPGSAPADKLTASDVIIRVTITMRRTSTSNLLGEEIVLALRREPSGYVIYRVVEDFNVQP